MDNLQQLIKQVIGGTSRGFAGCSAVERIYSSGKKFSDTVEILLNPTDKWKLA